MTTASPPHATVCRFCNRRQPFFLIFLFLKRKKNISAAQEPVVYPMRSFLLPRIIYASSKPVLLMFFSLTDPAVFLPDHAIYFIITHNEKMLNHFRIFFQKRSIFPGCFSISETYSFPSFLLFQTPQLFFLPVLQFFHQFPYFQAAQSHSFLLPAPVPGDTGRKYSAR